MPRFSVYTERFNRVVGQVVEAGMVSRWFQDLLTKAEQKQRGKNQGRQSVEEAAGSSSATKTLGLYHLQGTFALLGFGWLLAGVAFLMERAVSKRYKWGTHHQLTDDVIKSQTTLNFK
ncbi:uncharacterized protein LOC119582595 [Penaeus monodon]|uniref:uncharacterized protein LOC119582595 n=1 Tax=Penaeus monodon TaxID=6687 RepID=UPI0018A7ACB5|nr:uncharacterized protein LOC119582595 [Penaeus monodon]